MNSALPLSANHVPDHPLWLKLQHYHFGPEGAPLSFTARLARENGWTPAFAARVIAEYRRFCFLAATCDQEVTPSDQVDQAWHLHLTYTRDYWQHFCPEVLGRPLHHGPTRGGAEELHRFHEQYARTLQAYEMAFGAPPADIWSPAAQRLRDDPRARRVHPRDGLVLTRRAIVLGALTLLLIGLLIGTLLA